MCGIAEPASRGSDVPDSHGIGAAEIGKEDHGIHGAAADNRHEAVAFPHAGLGEIFNSSHSTNPSIGRHGDNGVFFHPEGIGVNGNLFGLPSPDLASAFITIGRGHFLQFGFHDAPQFSV